jgi:hypothetical protein
MAITIIAKIAATLEARRGCEASGNTEWFEKHSATLEAIEKNDLPHGSGFDMGCRIDLERSNAKAIYIDTSYHHMNEDGYYTGWSDHTLKVIPTFDGFDFTISGRNRAGIKDYLGDVFYTALAIEIVEP